MVLINYTMHSFFNQIQDDSELSSVCKLDLTSLPKAYCGSKVKAILLGADPTNNGIKGKPGLIELETVFGLDSEYEKYFFSPQKINLNALGLTKDNLYVQNACRNYFKDETSKNKYWEEAAKIWLPNLKSELSLYDNTIPPVVHLANE